MTLTLLSSWMIYKFAIKVDIWYLHLALWESNSVLYNLIDFMSYYSIKATNKATIFKLIVNGRQKTSTVSKNYDKQKRNHLKYENKLFQ